MVAAAVFSSALATGAGWPSPLEATAEQLMEWTPVGVASALLLHLGELARPAALLGALAAVMLAGGIAGSIDGIFPCTRLGRSLGFLAAVLCLYTLLLRLIPPAVPASDLSLIMGFIICLAVLRATPRAAEGRRAALIRTGTIVGGATVLLALFSVRPLFSALAERTLFHFKSPRGLRVPGITSLVTDASDFYIMDKVLQYPQIGPPDWKLTIDGQVKRSLGVDYGGLLGRRSVSRYVTLECVDNPVGGPLISNGLWTGVLLADLLRDAGASGNTVAFHSADAYTETGARANLEAAGALIAYGLNGRVLPRAHGYPARLVVPGIYGFKSVKWIERIEVVTGPQPGDWQTHGWNEGAVIHSTCRVDVARRTADSVLLAGVAFAGDRGIRSVEVRVEGGEWHRATLGRALSSMTWVQWAIYMRGSGPRRFEVRTVDGRGTVQSARARGPYPDGASGWTSVVA